jgi:5'-nucleotidase (lipoprotein e(P4) family)
MRRSPGIAVLAVTLLLAPISILPGQRPPTNHKEIKWVRDSREYATLTRQVYRVAGERVVAAAKTVQRGRPWAVVMDLDETVLDNSAYQLEVASYGTPFDSASWNAWARRGEAGVVPGAAEFIETVRAAGGRLAFVSGREESTAEATRANLERLGLWTEGDRLCLRDAAATYTKRMRREEVRSGLGRCAWDGQPVSVLAYVGDTMADFPDADEDTGAFGERYFLLPNPMYGTWERAVTRN